MISERKKILVVDDSSTMRQLIKMMLVKCGTFDISEAVDGQEAFDALTPAEMLTARPDLHAIVGKDGTS